MFFWRTQFLFAPSSWLILDAKGLQLQTFCVATLTPRGDPLSASLRALVGEGCEGYPAQRAF